MKRQKLGRIVRELRELVGSGNVLTAHEDLYCYSRDASWFQAMPDVVVRPHTTEEVAAVVRLANEEKVPITPRGAGTNLSGGAIPIQGGIVVDLSGMRRIIEIDRTNLRAIVEPGVIHAELERELAKHGLFWPPDPASSEVCTMGGILAECGGGMRALKYGTARDWVLGLEVVLPTGEVIQTGALTLKCASGWDFTRLFIRSEGMLGIITKAILKVRPLPEAMVRMFAVFDELEAAASTVAMIFEAGVVPTIMEILDRPTIRVVNEYAKLRLPEAGAIIILDIDGTKEECEKLAAKVETILRKAGAKSISRATTKREMEELYAARRAAFPALSQLSPTTLIEDVTVPVSKLPEMIKRIEDISRKHGVFIATFGHVGDGNLHPVICTDERNPEVWNRAMRCFEEIFRAALELGGTISGEHGVGLAKVPFFKEEAGEVVIDLMRKIKKVIDPNNIMNPGKMAL